MTTGTTQARPPEYGGANGSASGLIGCVGCRKFFPRSMVYYVGGPNEDEPLCAPCSVDALLACRMKMQNKDLSNTP